jgi:hypothetical protein
MLTVSRADIESGTRENAPREVGVSRFSPCSHGGSPSSTVGAVCPGTWRSNTAGRTINPIGCRLLQPDLVRRRVAVHRTFAPFLAAACAPSLTVVSPQSSCQISLLRRGQSEPRLVAVGDSRGKRPPETEPNDVVPAVAGVPDAEGRAEEPRIEVPSAAANDTVTTAAGCPS